MRWKIVIFPNVAMTFNLDNRIVLHLRHWGERIKNGRFCPQGTRTRNSRRAKTLRQNSEGFGRFLSYSITSGGNISSTVPVIRRLAAHTGALQFSVSGFPAFNVLRPPADQNAGDAPPSFLRHHGYGEV